MALLSQQEIDSKLSKLPVTWSVIGGTQLVNDFKFKDFNEALGFVIKVGRIAEKQDHHPDVQLSWGKVGLHITTHSESGLTAKDFKLAQEIAKLS